MQVEQNEKSIAASLEISNDEQDEEEAGEKDEKLFLPLYSICNSGTSEKLWRQRLASFAGFARKSLAISPHHIIGVIKLIYYILP